MRHYLILAITIIVLLPGCSASRSARSVEESLPELQLGDPEEAKKALEAAVTLLEPKGAPRVVFVLPSGVDSAAEDVFRAVRDVVSVKEAEQPQASAAKYFVVSRFVIEPNGGWLGGNMAGVGHGLSLSRQDGEWSAFVMVTTVP